MTPPLVSICMPCYNAEPYVAAALESALAQTWRCLEIVAVNDGSTDGTGAILDRFRARGVTVVTQDNAGAAAARNRALALSRGEFILFLDADDLVAPVHLEALCAAVPRGSRCIGMSQWDRFSTDPAEAEFPWRITYQDLPGLDWLALDWKEGTPMTQSGMFLIPRRLLDCAGAWDETLSLIDDFEFFSRIISQSEGIRFTPQAQLFYRSSVSSSLSSKKDQRAADSACRSLLRGTTYLLEKKDTSATRLAAANVLQSFIYEFYPKFPALQFMICKRIAELGGADMEPPGPPGFQRLRRWTGWRVARRVQLLAEQWGVNRAGRIGQLSKKIGL